MKTTPPPVSGRLVTVLAILMILFSVGVMARELGISSDSSSWSDSSGSSTPTVPEPGTTSLCGVGALLLLRRRR